jgi:hypothetical protein
MGDRPARTLLFMSRGAIMFICALLFSGPALAAPTDAEIRQAIIQLSIAAYSGNCACPYSLDARGHRCGARSAYSKPRGATPLCYPTDVSDEMVARYRKG